VSERVTRLSLDINILFADVLSARLGRSQSAATMLVDAVRDGRCRAGPVQLIISVPIIENWADVLRRHFHYDPEAANAKAWSLYDYAVEGPLGTLPSLVVGAGHIPFASEQDQQRAILDHMRPENAGKLLAEISDDRHVLLAAVAGHADILVTADMQDFTRRPTIRFRDRTDVVLFEYADRALVVARPGFVAHWFDQGIVPDATFLAERRDDFVRLD